ncbi:hypothetical protein COCMIDRAFT_31379 [Bipolaris oryzae ATCC 44560]|uniref:Uncharacterized protein n=1 Tax=Bipolaris oryzae ATCC 44560 TaxID=930090 RepID=W6ZUM3_COCMI|nr:uncharacterized protein COCMIDRAFT_31379 [Bipolaris oryzae ATCC 44560]EUC51234.1 hypothetical protein COCMIDRAFT_31379 [Bipolaris oryzae ATCC 44560]
MSSTDSTAKGWTDRQRLAYYFSLVEYSNIKLDFTGKSVGACRIMVDRLKGTLKDELAALRGADAGADDSTTPKKAATTPRKRKAKGKAEAEVEEENNTPVKREKKKKNVEDIDEEEEEIEDVIQDSTRPEV